MVFGVRLINVKIMSMRKIFLFFFLYPFFLLGENLFKGEGVIILPLPSYKGSGVYENISMISIASIDKKSFLVAWMGERYKTDLMVDEKEIEKEAYEKGGIIKSKNPYKSLESFNFLTIMDKKGKINSISNDLEMKEIYGSSTHLLIMDETEKCPYGFLSSKKIICYDFNLTEKKSIEVPIDYVNDVKVSFDGKFHTLWIFGKSFNEKIKISSLEEYDNQKPKAPSKLGIKFILEKEKFEDLPFNFNEIYNEISRVARDEEGNKVNINPALINLSVISDTQKYGSFWIWAEAAEAKEPESIFKYEGKIHFFKILVNSYGLGKVIQMPFWIKKVNIKEEKIDKEKGVLYLPPFVKNDKKTGAFLIGENSILYHFRASVAFPDEKGKYDLKDRPILSYFIFFPSEKESPEFFDFYNEIWPQLKEDLESDDFTAIPMFGIYGRMGKYDFLFKGGCKEKNVMKDCLIKAFLQR